ncbi:uncharacterized protein J8A68_002960 [[Candida] subhashii]|uniref:Uncharacterized protein n=1 Tax=[Candida] subhashii TaxID=561895 RepID=A0A8J5QFE1_9ASCO|nr:uncharacterized protein J8A68_002960 [[Candida] subhashii]KAG7663501.1 hypothetical protein J8A68_002960 [[Candida] subhashii]
MSQRTPSMMQRAIVAIVAIAAGAWVVKETGKDLEFVTYTPHTPEEVERRKREKVGFNMTVLETTTLDYKPEAKERMRKALEARALAEAEKAKAQETKLDDSK